MKLYPDDASCGAASDVAINGEQFIDEKPTFVIQNQSDNSSVSVYLLSNNPKEAVTADTVTSSCSTAAEKTHDAVKNSESSSSSAAAAKSSGAGSRYETLDRQWYENLERIKPCIIDGKMDYSCIDDSNDRKKLSNWSKRQRKYFRMRNNEDTPLTDERLKALMDINFPFNVLKKSSGVESGKSYLLSNNPKEAVTSDTVTSSCSTAAGKTHDAVKNSESSSSSAAAAKSSGAGSRYETLDRQWYENLERIKPCIIDGKMDYSCIDDSNDRKKLSNWSKRQRKYFRMRNNNEDTPITDERLKALMEINFPFDVLKKGKCTESGKSSSKKDAIILSLTDENYRQLMEEYFKKLGARTIGEKQVNEEKAAAQQVFNKLKGKGGRFVRLVNPRNLGGGHEEMDDDEAFQKIRQDISRRMGTAKRWLGPKHSSSAKDKASTSQQLKKRSQSNNHVQPSKRPCINTVGNEIRSDNSSKPKCSVKVDKLEYIGNYIANHVSGWEPQQRTNRLGLDHYVIFREGCDKKTAVEGKDKFTGYDKLAIWAFETHYYTEHVVETVPGKEILERLGIMQDPYSIFVERDKGLNTGERAVVSRDNRCDSSSQQLQQQTNANSGRENEIDSQAQVRAGVHRDNRPPSDSAPHQLPQQTSTSSVHLPAAGSGNSQNVEGSFDGFKRFRQTVSDLKSLLSSAEEKRDEHMIKFYGHLCRWLEMKSSDAAFVMSFRRDDIDAAVQEFKSVLSDFERMNDTTFKNLVEILIDQTTKIFPVADN